MHPATTQIYTLSLHDALPILCQPGTHVSARWSQSRGRVTARAGAAARYRDRKSTRLNSSHGSRSYAVFCLKKKRLREEKRAGSEERNGTERRCMRAVLTAVDG